MNTMERPFNFSRMTNLDDFTREMQSAGIELPVSDNLSNLANPIRIGSRTCQNSLAIHPLEGFDGTTDGRPSDLIYRRYERYARGGAGLIWYEAISMSPDGRCNPYQMWINRDTVGDIKKLVDRTNQAALDSRGVKLYNVIQLTHSGRESKDANWGKIPLVAFPNPYIDKYYENITIATDERIEQMEEEMVEGAVLSAEAGFDSVDIKICHNYIMRELLAAFTRPGKYGGSFENRTRFLFNVIDKIRNRLGDAIDLCVRLNAYDCIPYPYGWGMKQEEGVQQSDLSEPIRLVKMLVDRDIRLINISTMMPRFHPNNSSYLDKYAGKAVLNPYISTAYLLDATRQIKQAVPEAILVATGLSWFEQFGANVGAGGIAEGWFDMAGFGRQAFAYPDFAADILDHGEMVRSKCCLGCDKCYELIRMHQFSGCPVRDTEQYLASYRNAKALVK